MKYRVLNTSPEVMSVSTEILDNRIDAHHYRPPFIAAAEKVLNVKQSRPSVLGNAAYRIGQPADIRKYSTSGKPILNARNVRPLCLNNNDCPLVESEIAENHEKQKLKGSEVLIVRTGANCGDVAWVPNRYIGYLVNSHVIPIRTKKQLQSAFLAAYLSSNLAKMLLDREMTGAAQRQVSVASLNSTIIPLPDEAIQTYIGQKIELAEKCRDNASDFKIKAKKEFEISIQWDAKFELPLLSHWVSIDLMSSRMDLNFNSPRKIRLLEFIKNATFKCEQFDSLVDISAMIGWKGLTTEHYVDEGPWLLRGVEFRDGYIDFDALVSVEQYKYDEQPQIHLKHRDIAMTKDGTIGKALVVPKLSKPMAAGSTIARLRIKNGKDINPYYLELVINHPVVQIQIQSFATGLAQPHITQEWIAQLMIPRVTSKESDISGLVAKHHYLMEKAHNLSKEAKCDVESLIEGKLDTDAILSGNLKVPTWEEIEKELEGI